MPLASIEGKLGLFDFIHGEREQRLTGEHPTGVRLGVASWGNP